MDINNIGPTAYQNNVNPAAKSGGNIIDGLYEDPNKNNVSIDNFLQMMVQQLSNQDFLNPMDDSQYLTQMATFATMQQMQELAYFSKSNYAMSLAGKDVTVARLGIGGKVDRIEGPVEKIAFLDNEYKIFVKGQAFSLNQIMEVNGISAGGSAGGSDIPPSEKLVIGVTNKTNKSIDISWDAPEIKDQDKGKFKYSVYYSTSNNFNTLSDVKKGTLVGEADQPNITSSSITGLNPDTTYFINVVIKDETGKETVYTKGVATTLK
ncbi:MAG: flagellar hook capping FlgD N-terminal domain-containing protein [Oscillospiraceae bacterium]